MSRVFRHISFGTRVPALQQQQLHEGKTEQLLVGHAFSLSACLPTHPVKSWQGSLRLARHKAYLNPSLRALVRNRPLRPSWAEGSRVGGQGPRREEVAPRTAPPP